MLAGKKARLKLRIREERVKRGMGVLSLNLRPALV
tara:strand:+ start:193 stop:297 length:105 start_codon:yes stop_codon:yes gene_type:complete